MMAIITTKCEADRAFALTPSLCTACPQDQESEIAPGTASRDQWRPIDTGEARRGPFPLTSWANAPSVISQVHRPRTRLSRQHTRAIGRADVLSADVCDLLKYLLGTNAAKFTHTCRSTLFEPDGGIHGKIPINQRCRSVLRWQDLQWPGRSSQAQAARLRACFVPPAKLEIPTANTAITWPGANGDSAATGTVLWIMLACATLTSYRENAASISRAECFLARR